MTALERTGSVAALLGACLAASIASAQQAPEPREPEPPRVAVGGFVDIPYTFNFNRPSDHANFFPGVGTSAKRDDEFGVNLAEVDLTVQPAPVGFKLSLGFGTATEVVHAGEVRGAATGPDVWRHVVQASAQYKTGVGKGLLLEAGVYPSHIGLESFASKDNWNYTRSWLGELSPYYQTGLKLSYPFSARWSGQLHVLNGWQNIADNNRGKSVGVQVAYGGEKLSASFNGIAGPELADDTKDVRALADVVFTYKATAALSLGFSCDAAREGRQAGDPATWQGVGVYGRLASGSGRAALALRAEVYDDGSGAISGIAQTLREVTATLERRPSEHLFLKLEGRYDHSSAAVFGSSRTAPDGSAVRGRHQVLLLMSAVAAF